MTPWEQPDEVGDHPIDEPGPHTNFPGVATEYLDGTGAFSTPAGGGGSAIPPGVILPYGANAAPSPDWILCDGTAVSRATFAALFAVIGIAFGPGDGATTFNVPDMRAAVPIGLWSGDAAIDTIGELGFNLRHDHGNHNLGSDLLDHGELIHTANHTVTQPAAHVVTQPGAHAAHVFTQPAAHVVTQPSNHVVTDPTFHDNHDLGDDLLAHGTLSHTAHSAHAGGAVDAHAVTQPNNHAAHVVTQPSGHAAHVVTQPNAHGTHTHTIPAPFTRATGGSGYHANTTDANAAGTGATTHAGTAVDAHSAHAGTAVAAHVFTQPSGHAAHTDHPELNHAGVTAHTAHTGTAVSAHAGTAVDAHAGGAVDAHSAHAGTAVDAHTGTAVAAHGNHPELSHAGIASHGNDIGFPYVVTTYIIKT